MRIKTIVGALAVALCAFGIVSAPAFAKEKKVFGEFVASQTGHNLETEPGILRVNKEDTPEVTGLQLGNYTFGPLNSEGDQEKGEPCKKLKVTGMVHAEHSSSLTADFHFSKCTAIAGQRGVIESKNVSFTLGIKFISNFSAEAGKSGELEIEPGVVTFKGALRHCPVTIPRQTIPYKENAEKEYEEIVSYSPEEEEIENFEKSKKLKEMYPTGKKQRLEIELGEKFKGLRTYVAQNKYCSNAKGEESGKLVEDKESPYFGMLEFSTGHIFADVEGLEVKNGQLTFVEPA